MPGLKFFLLSVENFYVPSLFFKLRDWIFARQRYWGEPIPIIHCKKCGDVAVPKDQLPLTLPKITDFKTTKEDMSPLAAIDEFVNTKCPKCGDDAKRETDTMPQWAGSSWYYLRYCSPNFENALAKKEDLEYWLPVDWYNGGMEHTTLHLLYSRFWHKFLYDIGVVSCIEPYQKRTSHGMVLGENGEKMSKSRGNVVNPDEVVLKYGADTFRLYELFMGDFEKAAPWDDSSIKGCQKFLNRVYDLQNIVEKGEIRNEFEIKINKMIKKVSQDIEKMKFNTAIAEMMSFLNEIYSKNSITTEEIKVFLILLNPFAPHLTEEMFSILHFKNKISDEKWPTYDRKKCEEEKIEIVLQINGKVKSKTLISKDISKDEILKIANNDEKIKSFISSKKVLKTIVVKNKLCNFVVE